MRQGNAKQHTRASQRRALPSWLPAVLLAILTAAVFSGALKNDFTYWDDDVYVLDNLLIRDLSPAGVQALFKARVSSHYHPLTLLSLAIDYRLWGLDPAGFIATNLALHLAAVVLAFFFLRRLSGDARTAFLAALLFAVHPMRVESVVWMAERKDVLFSALYLGALRTWLWHVDSGGRRAAPYLCTLGLFVLALLAKATAVSLPLVLLLVDVVRSRRVPVRMAIEKAPFLLLALAFGLVAIAVQRQQASNCPPMPDRIFLTTYALSFYAARFFIPLWQSAVIPFPRTGNGLLPLLFYLSAAVPPAAVAGVYFARRLRGPVIFGLGLFAAALAPLLIRFPIGPAYLAERYTYLPHLGLAYLVAGAWALLRERAPGRPVTRAATAALVLFPIFLAVRTVQRIPVWRDGIALFADVLQRNPDVTVAYNQLGLGYVRANRPGDAMAAFHRGIERDPGFPPLFNNRGKLRLTHGHIDTGMADLDRAIQLDPGYVDAIYNRGTAHLEAGNLDAAMADLERAASLDPERADTFLNRGNTRYRQGDNRGALDDYARALALNPDFASAYHNRGLVRMQQGDTTGAMEDITRAIALEPKAIYYLNRAHVNRSAGRPDAAERDLREARRRGAPTP